MSHPPTRLATTDGEQMETLFKIFHLPIMILNTFGFIGSALWLLIIGQWRSVVAGIFVFIVANFTIGLALLPGLALGAPGIYFARRRITIGVYFFGLLSSIYTYVLITAWCAGVTFYFIRDAPTGAFWPLLIWAYGVATAPWTYVAQQDGSIAGFIAAFFMQVAYIVMLAAIALGVSLSAAVDVFGVVMAVGVITQMRMLAEANRMGAFEE
jgi:hypothetical protein